MSYPTFTRQDLDKLGLQGIEDMLRSYGEAVGGLGLIVNHPDEQLEFTYHKHEDVFQLRLVVYMNEYDASGNPTVHMNYTPDHVLEDLRSQGRIIYVTYQSPRLLDLILFALYGVEYH